jgi:plastocyanin
MRILLISAALAVGLVAAAPTGAADGQLTGSVGPGFAITVKDSNGTDVKHLDPGTYTLLVHDLSEEHNFHLSGPGVDVATDITFVGDKTFTITVKDGNYSFVCDFHPSRMVGSFTAGNAPPPTTTGSSPPAPRPLTLRVGPGRTLAAPTKLSAGRYAITAKDASAADNLHLKGAGVDRKTGVAFKGQARWTVTLKAGTYRVFSDSHATLKRTIRVS